MPQSLYRLGMAWTYSDWRSQSSDSARLTRIRLHIQELTDYMAADSGSSHGTVAFANIRALIASLELQERTLAKNVEGLDSTSSAVEGSIIRGIPR